MVVFLNTTIFSLALYMPILVGIISGYIFGFLFNQRRVKHAALYLAIEHQKILNEILLLSNQDVELGDLLNKTIQLILNSSFGKLEAKGGIFLMDEDHILRLKSSINLDDFIIKKCGVKGIKLGECLCGIAAERKETIYKKCLDHEHSHNFEGMVNHGHYNVPILFNNKTLGVIMVYLDINHKYNSNEIKFLEAVANALSIIINKIKIDNYATRSESILKEIQHFAGIGTWSLNISSGNIIASDEVFSIMGYHPQQFQYNEAQYLNVTHKDDLEELKEVLLKAKSGEPFEIESRHIDKNGSIVHVINKCQPQRLKSGKVHELTGIIIDVTKLREKEAELLEKQDLVNGILSATPDMLYLIDLTSNEMIYYNTVMRKVLENDPKFLANLKKIGVKIFYEHVHPEDLYRFNEMDKILRSGADFHTFSFRTKAIQNDYRWLEQRVFVYSRDKNGLVRQVLIISKDIDEKMLAEERVTNLNKKLLLQFRDLKKVNTELDQFVYSVSHDLRAPLSSILGLVNLCKTNPEKKLLVECISRIGASTVKLDNFIKEILDYSRNSRTEIEVERFNIEELVNELIDNIRLLGNLDNELNVNASEKITYEGDRRRVSIILNNLITNACKYADPDKLNRFVNISITTSKMGFELIIEDNGIGINSDSLDKVFNMFYRGTETSEGSGLGLYIVNETLTKLKGKIDISSKEGVGTKISIQIPRAKKIAELAKKGKKKSRVSGTA